MRGGHSDPNESLPMAAFSLFGFSALQARLYGGLTKMRSPWRSVFVISLAGFRIDTPGEVSVRPFPQRPKRGRKTDTDCGRHHPWIERKKKDEMSISACPSVSLPKCACDVTSYSSSSSTPSPPRHAARATPLDCDTKWTLLAFVRVCSRYLLCAWTWTVWPNRGGDSCLWVWPLKRKERKPLLTLSCGGQRLDCWLHSPQAEWRTMGGHLPCVSVKAF